MSKVIREWEILKDGRYVLYLDEPPQYNKSYHSYRIGGVTYKPIPMSHTNGKCIAVKGTGNFIGKEVEFIEEKQ